MKITSFLIAFTMLCIGGSAFAQHNLQLDRSGNYYIIQGTGTGGTYTLPANGGTLVTTNGTNSTVWLLGGNTGAGANNQIGTLDGTGLNFVTGTGGPNTRMSISSTGNGDVSFTGNLLPALNGGSDLGTNAFRWGRLKLSASIDNTGDNPIANDNQGIANNGIGWKVSGTGFVANFINEDNTSGNRDGIQIAVANNDGASRAVVVTTGTNFNPTGGGGVRNEVFRVMNDGSMFSSSSVTVGGGNPITKVLIAESALPAFAAPAGGDVALVFNLPAGFVKDLRDQAVFTLNDPTLINNQCVWTAHAINLTQVRINIHNFSGGAANVPAATTGRLTITSFN